MLSKRHQDDVCRERGEQLRLQAEERRRKEQGGNIYTYISRVCATAGCSILLWIIKWS